MKVKFKVLKNVGSTEVKLNNLNAKNSKTEDITINSENLKVKGSINFFILIVAVVILLIIIIVVIIKRKNKEAKK